MEEHKVLGRVSQSPTVPGKKHEKRKFDIADLYSKPVSTGEEKKAGEYGLDEKLRKAYFWIANYAIINPFCDIEYNDAPPNRYAMGDNRSDLTLATDQSYASFILFPLLTLVTRKKCLLVGGPGRGKTSSAMIMGLLAGYSMEEIKRAVQHGQPQMTVSDLLGNPLPSDMVNAKSMDEIKIAWRKWLEMKVKIIDEYNRIPVRTQSALLNVMSENYAELLDQVYDCPEAAWYLTANDDAGGGTYQVIEALKDRIDVVVMALHFNTRFLGDLLDRVERGIKPEEAIPPEIIFTEDEIESINREILEVEIPDKLMRRIEYFASQFELLESGGDQFEYKTKDNVKLSGFPIPQVMQGETGKDQLKDLSYQTLNGLSVRAFMTCLTFIKALAYFRGNHSAEFNDVRHILPFVLHDKLAQNSDSPFFEQPENMVYRYDRVSWIRKLFDLSCAEYDRAGLDKKDPVGEMLASFRKGLEGITEAEVAKVLQQIEKMMGEVSAGRKLYAPKFDDVLTLKYLHQRYTNYLNWLKWKE
ncbi:MAG TPA: AAA family ATPase [Spirochaetota bacterium]|nr:AAA family ATPase [Spirochaetota bacterium]HPJ34863.1 AAA family ATPase [Spirochaetota bacterium]